MEKLGLTGKYLMDKMCMFLFRQSLGGRQELRGHQFITRHTPTQTHAFLLETIYINQCNMRKVEKTQAGTDNNVCCHCIRQHDDLRCNCVPLRPTDTGKHI